MTYEEAERILDTYDLDEILSLNELTVADALIFLVKEEFVTLPNILPVDLND